MTGPPGRLISSFVLLVALVIVGSALASGCATAATADLLLLRDGSEKRGPLWACDPSNCWVGAETVPRAEIEWIGLGRGAPAPQVRNPAHDELHLVDKSVQSVTLIGVDPEFVHTTVGGQTMAPSRLPRAKIAWIHLARSAPPEAATEPEATAEQESSDTDAWRLPARIYIWDPRRCPTCSAGLHVLELELELDADRETVLLVKKRTIEISPGLVTGSWFSYDPPVPLFPATTVVDYFAFDGELKTSVTHHYFLANRGAEGSGSGAGGASSGGGAAGGQGQSSESSQIDNVVRPLADVATVLAIGVPSDNPEEWWRERMARDHAAARAASPPGGAGGTGGARQHGVYTGTATYTQSLQVNNWPIRADEIVKRRDPGWESYRALQRIPVYDVHVDLRFSLHDYVGAGRDVDSRGYTTDWSQPGRAGPRAQPPVDDLVASAMNAEPRPSPEVGGEPGPIDWLLGARAERVREAVADAGERVADVRQGAADWLRDRLAADREALDAEAGGASGGQQGTGSTAALPHAVSLSMRWFRAEGRVTSQYYVDIIQNVVEGHEEQYDLVVSATLPRGAFDIREPPFWTPPNPEPPQPRSNFNWNP